MGGEGYEPNITLIRNDAGQDAAMASDGVWTGWHSVDTLNRVFAGEQPAPQGIGFTAIDRDHNLPPEGEGFQTQIDYRSIYLGVWGVEG